MKHHPKMHRVQFIDVRFRSWEICGVKAELLVSGRKSGGGLLRVPTRRGESSTEIDQCVTRQFLFTELLRDGFHAFVAAERAMRLLIPERPQRRHFRMAGD